MNREIDRRIKEARLTPTEQKIAEYISLNHSNIFSLSALRLGELIGTSDTSVIRTARKLGFAGYETVSGGEKIFEDRIRSIVEDMNPLEGERALLGMYFDFLSSREGGSPFSSRALMIYALKLQLMERSSSFSQEKGLEEFDRLYKEIETDIFR